MERHFFFELIPVVSVGKVSTLREVTVKTELAVIRSGCFGGAPDVDGTALPSFLDPAA